MEKCKSKLLRTSSLLLLLLHQVANREHLIPDHEQQDILAQLERFHLTLPRLQARDP